MFCVWAMPIFNFLLCLLHHLEQTRIKYQNATLFTLKLSEHSNLYKYLQSKKTNKQKKPCNKKWTVLKNIRWELKHTIFTYAA